MGEFVAVDVPAGDLLFSIGPGDQNKNIIVIREYKVSAEKQHVKVLNELRQTTRLGDQLMQIDGVDVSKLPLTELIQLLQSTSKFPRQMVFYRDAPLSKADKPSYNPKKIVKVKLKDGPLGAVLNQDICDAAIIESFIDVKNKNSEAFRKNSSKVYYGCQMIKINDIDVSLYNRAEIAKLITDIAKANKEISFYQLIPKNCEAIIRVRAVGGTLGLNFDPNNKAQCVLASLSEKCKQLYIRNSCLLPGDILISINRIDLSTHNRDAIITLLQEHSNENKVLTFFRKTNIPVEATPTIEVATPVPAIVQPEPAKLPEPQFCEILISKGSLGLDLDPSITEHAKVKNFASADVREREEYKKYADFLPGTYLISINKLDVTSKTQSEIALLLQKFKDGPRNIVFGNKLFFDNALTSLSNITVQIGSGKLGIEFDSAFTGSAVVNGLSKLPNNEVGAVEKDGRVQKGHVVSMIDGFNVSYLTLHQVTTILQKLSDSPKTITFSRNGLTDESRTVNVCSRKGPIGIILSDSVDHKVIIQGINDAKDFSVQNTIRDNGGIQVGSRLVAIDGMDVTNLNITDVTNILKGLAGYSKILTFTTSINDHIQSIPNASAVNVKVCPGSLCIEFDGNNTNQAIITNFRKDPNGQPGSIERDGNIPIGSTMIAIDGIDIRANSMADVIALLTKLSHTEKVITFLVPQKLESESLTDTIDPIPSTSNLDQPVAPPAPLQRRVSEYETKEQMTPPVAPLRRVRSTEDKSVKVSILPEIEPVELVPATPCDEVNSSKKEDPRDALSELFNSESTVRRHGGVLGPKVKNIRFDVKSNSFWISDSKSMKSTKYIPLLSIMDVIEGQEAPSFKKSKKVNQNNCLSFSTGKKSVDLEFRSVQIRDSVLKYTREALSI